MDNVTVHPQSLIGKFSNIKIVFLPKKTTSGLQPLDAGITQSFKVKYRQKLMQYVLVWISNDRCPSETANTIYILQAIQWIVNALKGVSDNTTKNYFANVVL